MSSNPDRVAERRRQLGSRLKAFRVGAGLTQERLALLAGFDRSFYVDVENGHHSLALDRLFAVADALEIPASQLLEGIK